MQQLLDKVRSISKKRLAAYQVELAEREQGELGDLRQETLALERRVAHLEHTLDKQAALRQEFVGEISSRFAVLQEKRRLARKLWDEVFTARVLEAPAADQHEWLLQQLRATQGKSGVVRAGASHDVLVKLLGQLPAKAADKIADKAAGDEYGKLILKKDISIDQLGFIFESEHHLIDARAQVVSDSLFARAANKLQIELFGQEA